MLKNHHFGRNFGGTTLLGANLGVPPKMNFKFLDKILSHMKDKKISAGFENYVVFLGPPPPGDEELKKISYMINQLPHRVIRFLKNVILMLEKSIFRYKVWHE